MSVTRPSLLLSRILGFRDLSPLIILKDSAFQSSHPVLQLFESSARTAKLKVIRIGWQSTSDVCTLTAGPGIPQPRRIDQIIDDIRRLADGPQRTLLIIPDLNDFLLFSSSSSSTSSSSAAASTSSSSNAPSNAGHLSAFLSSILSIRPGLMSVVCAYHTDIPTLNYPSHLPSPLTLLDYLGTTVIEVESMPHVLARRDAERKSRTSTVILDLEGRDIVLPLGSNASEVYLCIDHRRKSGRGVVESCCYDARSGTLVDVARVPGYSAPVSTPSAGVGAGAGANTGVGARSSTNPTQVNGSSTTGDVLDESGLSFKISLSDSQKAVRDGLVLPHFKAQDGYWHTTPDRSSESGTAPSSVTHGDAGAAARGDGSGGGHIYYEPDSGDDFDDEDPDDDLIL